MPDKVLKVLCVHGLGDHRGSDWEAAWTRAIADAFPAPPGVTLDFTFVTYDDIFANTRLSLWECIAAVAKLAASGVTSVFRRQRGVTGDISERLRWTAGYVVAWVEDEAFRRRSRARVLEAVATHSPDIILAHSLGSLVTYNAFSHPDARAPTVAEALKQATYVTFGSQINNPFVLKNLTNGRIQRLDVAWWHHLYNRHDDVFTAPILNWSPEPLNFSQTETPFDKDGVGDHAAERYLGHVATVENVWRPLAARASGARSFTLTGEPGRARPQTERAPVRKALLIGINDYPDPAQRLEGCINDVFTMSAVLQECGFPPEAIRTCLDDRATASGILERLRWLLDEARPGDELLFYFSGHGVRIPEYGERFEPDRHVEALVPWDFDWTPETAVADEQIHYLYSQLPYDTRLVMIFDCCHSGGIHRDGGARARGITPPDDIRHRELKWDAQTRMWVPRDFERINPRFTSERAVARRYFGRDGATSRLGRAGMLRGLTSAQYNALRKTDPAMARGPYLPLIIESCREEQLSYEYRHGAASHGAFTYCLARVLEEEPELTFEALVARTGARLADLGYEQVPQILGPTAVMQAPVPWTGRRLQSGGNVSPLTRPRRRTRPVPARAPSDR